MHTPIIAVVGSRTVSPLQALAVRQLIAGLPHCARLITGCAGGVDALAAQTGAIVINARSRRSAALAQRTAAVVAAVRAGGPGSGVVALFARRRSPGTLLACRLAIAAGLPVWVRAMGVPLPQLGDGAVGPAQHGCRLWVPAQQFLFAL